jgi:succinate-semialdehyde dehydrogenase/glutarate-semialdehyde dehydrogenase
MNIEVVNPATEEVINSYEQHSSKECFARLDTAQEAFLQWRDISISERVKLFERLAELLEKQQDQYAKLMTDEMGKSFAEAQAEVEKCAWMTRVYVEHSEKWLQAEQVEADGLEHYVSFEPFGVVLSIMPWNFPFWQVLRFAVPTIMAGNVSMLKHSNQVPGSALAIEQLFKDARFPEGVFQTLITNHHVVEEMMAHDLVRGISFTGSTQVGERIAELAGKNLKPVVLELGGSDPFIVLEDADLEKAAAGAAFGRFLNCGQSCIAAKRFIVAETVADKFIELFKKEVEKKSVGDPMSCALGPVVNRNGVTEIEEQVADALEQGAKLELGGKRLERRGFFFAPTILSNVTRQMRVFSEEVFGPVAPVITFKTEQEAVELANATPFGLGGSIWSEDRARAKKLAPYVECGSIFINSIVKSDPRMPFGGVKKSGLGRELGRYGLMMFVNVKGNSIY